MIQSLFSSDLPLSDAAIRAQILEAIKAREPLLKFAYLGQGAEAWDVFRRGDDCSVGSREVDALTLICRAFEPELRASAKHLNVVHLGSGNGIEIPTLFELFRLRGADSYNAVDVSRDLLELLVRDFNGFLTAKGATAAFFQADATDPRHLTQVSHRVRNAHAGTNLIVAAGEGTLLSDASVLANIRAALAPGDFALFSLDGCTAADIPDLCVQYDGENVRRFLSHAIACAKRVGALPERPGGEFLPAVFDEAHKQLRVYYKTESGQELLILRSLKPQSENDIRQIFGRSGLLPVHTLKTSRSSFGFVCKASS